MIYFLKRNFDAVLSVALVLTLFVYFSISSALNVFALDTQGDNSFSDTKAIYTEYYDEEKDMPSSSANDWQIVSQKYSTVKKNKTYNYSSDYTTRVQKAVLSGGEENEFQIYLAVESQLSWEEFFKSLDNYATHNKSSSFNPSSGCTRLLSPEEYELVPSGEKGNYASIAVTYKMKNVSYYVTRYGKFKGSGAIQPVNNGSYAWTSEKFSTNGLIRGINWSQLINQYEAGKVLDLTLNVADLADTYSFADGVVYPKSVTDPLGKNIIYRGLISADKGSVTEPDLGSKDGTIDWTLPTCDPPDLPYYSTHTEEGKIPGTEDKGYVTVLENLEDAVISDGKGGTKKTAYYIGILEMRYAASLDVLGDDFVSCAHPNDTPEEDAIVATNGETTLSYIVNDASSTIAFPVPEVKGLLYDLEVKKVDKLDSKKLLSGAIFDLVDDSGNQVLGPDGKPIEAESGSDGVAKFHNLPFGEYAAREISPPKGYAISATPTTGLLDLSWTTNKDLVQDHNDQPADLPDDVKNMIEADQPSVEDMLALGLEILKQDHTSLAPLANVNFKIFKDNGDGVFTADDPAAQLWTDKTFSKETSEGTTDSNGKLSFYGFVPGTYWISETRTVSGYKILDDPVKMLVTDDFRVFFHESQVEVTPDEDFVVHITIDNETINTLPVSGGTIGVVLLIFGIVCVAYAFHIFGQRNKRKHAI